MCRMLKGTFELSDKEFMVIKDLVYNTIGVNLTTAKKALVISRLSTRLRELNLNSFTSYIKFIEENPRELEKLFNLITTNVTNFFRETHHFDFLVQEYFPVLETAVRNRLMPKKIRIWSAGCSTGEEPYTLGMVMDRYFSEKRGWSMKILASDINTEALDKAQKGIYSMKEIEGIPYDFLKQYFVLGTGPNQGVFKVKEVIQKMITFRRLNLLSCRGFPVSEPLNLIFCRNVFIYFNKETQNRVLDKFYDLLVPEGYLFLGHSESIDFRGEQADRWRLIKHTIYQRIP